MVQIGAMTDLLDSTTLRQHLLPIARHDESHFCDSSDLEMAHGCRLGMRWSLSSTLARDNRQAVSQSRIVLEADFPPAFLQGQPNTYLTSHHQHPLVTTTV